ncbi:hypothetical protein Tco_1041601 [Tanacetum coccineum]|uniref:Uncharacterized protein n=1 Tax=Tanacetum coccineum TaxID=301880 RepID=A0ABQ5GI26_9ASTR
MQLKKRLHFILRRKIEDKLSNWQSGGISTASRFFSTVEELVSTDGASMPISTAGMVQEVNISIPSPVVIKDKSKSKMEESKDELTKRTKLQQEQDRFGHEATEEWENIRARVKADEELTQRLQGEERNKYNEVDQAKMLLKELFETTMKNVNAFIPMEIEDRKRASELAVGRSQATITDSADVGSSKRAAGVELDHECSKKQKTNEALGSVQGQPDEEDKEFADNRPPMLDKDMYDSWKKTKKYAELFVAEKIQADCDMKATNIILQGLPADIYLLVNHHRVAKDLWERVQLLMQGTSLTKQERECTLLPRKWSKFVTDVKLVKDLHTSNFDQLHAYLEQHELHANEVHLMRERNQRSTYIRCKSVYDIISLQYLSVFLQQSSTSTISQMNHQTSSVPQVIPQVTYQSPPAPTQLMTESPFVDSSFDVYVFSPGDDPIACLNKAMDYLTVVASSRFSSTNNQLKTSYNPRNQDTIQDGEILQVDREELLNAITANVKDIWLGNVLNLSDQGMQHDPGILAVRFENDQIARIMGYGDYQLGNVVILRGPETQICTQFLVITCLNYLRFVFYPKRQRLRAGYGTVDYLLALNEQKLTREQNLSKQIKEKESLFKTFTVFKNESKERENKYMENEFDLEKKIKELDNIVYKVGYQNPFYLRKAQRIKPTLYDGVVISKTHVAMLVIDDEETLILEEESRSKMFEKAKDPEVIAKEISHKPIDFEKLNRPNEDL